MNNLTLYHFTDGKSYESIREKGITKGVLPIFHLGGVRLVKDHQWLTAEPLADKQSWATNRQIKTDRAECRLTVRIPYKKRYNLHNAVEYMKRFHIEARGLVEDWEGSDDWYIYAGAIPPEWIIACEKKER